MRFLTVSFLLFAPCVAHAAELPGGTSGFSVVGSFLQMLASLGLVVGMIFVARHLVTRFQKGGLTNRKVPKHVRVVESRFLGPKKSLILVEVGGEYLLLGSTGEGVNLIKQIDMIESIEVVEDLSPSVKPANPLLESARSLLGCIGKRSSWWGSLERRVG
jgi:flagellar protein FliO/FliZ